MATIPEALRIALQQHQSGNLAQAEAIYRRVLEADPRHAHAWHLLGVIAHQAGNNHVAIEYMNRAIGIEPGMETFHNDLGEAYRAQKKLEEALVCYRESLRLRPDYAMAHNNLGNALHDQGDLDGALAEYQEALRLKPGYAEALSNLGCVHQKQGRLEEAVACYQEALRSAPGNGVVRNNLGVACKDQGSFTEAVAHFQEAIRLQPNNSEAHNNLGTIHLEQGRLDEAMACYREAVRLQPSFSEAHNNLGNAHFLRGEPELALACFEKAEMLAPHDGFKIKTALLMPVIPESAEAIDRQRRRLEENIARLLREDLTVIDPTHQGVMNVFYLAYHGRNDRALLAAVAALNARATPALGYVAPHCAPAAAAPVAQRPIKIGFISRYFYLHPVAKFYSGVVRNLSRDDFRVVVFRFPRADDAMSRSIRDSADDCVTLPLHLANARQRIAEEKLDVLFYTDIGMDLWTYFLAYARLAPVQCAGSGHPDTSGIPAVDYYLSDVDLDAPDAEEHYTEQLVRLDHFPFCFDPPRLPDQPRSRADFGLEEDKHLYVCGQTLFKIHPEFDALLGALLRADPDGRVVLFHGMQPSWTELLLRRLRRAIPHELDRVQFLPRQTNAGFLQVLQVCDVLLDTIHFSGGTSSFEAFSAGTPIVTLPGPYLRSRVTYACYRKMGIEECIASDPADYVRIAVRLGTDPEYRAALRGRILAAKDVLYDNLAGVRALERFFIEAVERGRGGGKKF